MSKYTKTQKYYDDYGKTYHDERNGTYYYSFINEIETAVASELAVNGKTLEIGCGTGIILNKIAAVADEAWGVDLSPGMLKGSKDQGLNVVCANVKEIPFASNTFDLVYSFKVLPHVPDISDGLNEISRVLKDDGVAVLEFYNKYSFKAITNYMARASSKVYVVFRSPAEIANLVEGSFVVERVVGARILTPLAFFHKIPFLNRLLKWLEVKLSRSFLSFFSGYYIVVLKKKKSSL